MSWHHCGRFGRLVGCVLAFLLPQLNKMNYFEDQTMRNIRLHEVAVICAAVVTLALVTPSLSVCSEDVEHDEASSRAARELDLKVLEAEMALAQANLEHS